MQAIANLASDPRPHGYIQLKGRSAFRVRVGDYRIIYEIYSEKLVVLIVEVGNRREVYR
ncbi:MAG TPA: type II toxin-antitoxin system RelE/ParE family toxin [Chitinophagales bacterium]|nr:type II toxin-antitoxin system RelE/ParE family toxin [Chitinophagales bacterium]